MIDRRSCGVTISGVDRALLEALVAFVLGLPFLAGGVYGSFSYMAASGG